MLDQTNALAYFILHIGLNIRHGLKYLPMTKALAYFAPLINVLILDSALNALSNKRSSLFYFIIKV
jgi:hypothetical protein